MMNMDRAIFDLNTSVGQPPSTCSCALSWTGAGPQPLRKQVSNDRNRRKPACRRRRTDQTVRLELRPAHPQGQTPPPDHARQVVLIPISLLSSMNASYRIAEAVDKFPKPGTFH